MSAQGTCPACQTTRTVDEIEGFDGRRIQPDPNGLCPDCLDAQEAERAQRDRWSLFMDRVNRSNLPEALHRKNISGGTVLGDSIRQWADGKLPVLVLTGPVGVGKTFAAAAACWRACDQRPVQWIEVALRMAQLSAGFGEESRKEALAAFTGTGAAIFDDLDKFAEKNCGLPALFAAIDSRVSRGAPVLVTMNSSLTELAAKIDKGTDLGQPIASRLAGGRLIRLEGDDKRMAA
jgi:hypothetical protein